MLWLMVLLSSLSTYAQNSLVGDGFGGRAGYCPTNYIASENSAFAICGANDQLNVWGANSYRNFGASTPSGTATPIAVPGMTNVRMFAGSRMSGAIKNDGTGWVWGVLGGQYPNTFTTPTQIITNAYHLDASTTGVSYVKTDGTVWSVGRNESGQYGNGTTTSSCISNPCSAVQMTGITTAVRVATMNDVTAVLLANGTVMQTGSDGTIVMPTSLRSLTPIPVPGLSNIVDIKANSINLFALTNTGQVYSWGFNTSMGTGVPIGGSTSYSPTLITFPAGAAPIKALSAGPNGIHGMALDENGNVYAWGQNNYGNLGTGNITNQTRPVLVATGVRDILAGDTYSYIVKTDGTIWATGTNINVAGANIFLNLSTAAKSSFTQMNPSAVGLCTPADFNCTPPCVAGTTAPAVTPTTATNSCPTTTVNLASLAISSTTPSGASLIWSTNKVPTSAADTLTTAQKAAVSTAGTYYALYYDATNACYSPADSVVVTITSCTASLTANTPAAQTATTGAAKTGNAATELAPTGGVSPYIYSNGSGDAACVAPSGTTLLTGLTVNSDGTYSYTAPTTAGTYYYCIKICDSATPTASCIVKTYTLTVAAPVTITNTCPTATVNLMTAISATNLPSGTTVTWHTGTPATAANQVADPTAISTSGTYYMAYYQASSNCYSLTSDGLIVTITSCGPDTDGDGVPDATDLDDDNDGISDATEGTADTDGDGVIDAKDLDADNDGINDVIEAGGTDANGDGKQDGTPNATTGQIGTGLTPPNSDNDTVPDYKDLDSDNDGVSDLQEGGSNGTDANNDGVVDGPDTDGDGIPNSVDGLAGFGDASSPALPNGDSDTIPDYRDVDSDGDGTMDIAEKAGKGTLDANNDGMVDSPTDPDGDGIANNSGLDTVPAGFGGLPTATGPDTDGDGVPDATDLDDDNDGISDATEGTADTDGDGVIDAKDLDADNDGINDVIEAGGTDANGDGKQDGTPNATTGQIGTGLTPPNSDNDAVPDYKDLDSDNDGVSDLQEGGSNGTDANNDGVVDGPDTDGDGIPNSVDGLAGFGDASSPALPNGDSDTIPDYRDVDSDGDGTMDIVEKAGKGTLDANNDGMVDSPTDPDGDGIANNSGLDTIPAGFGGLPTATGPTADLFANYTFGNVTFKVNDTRTVIININEIKGGATNGTIEFFVPTMIGYTVTFTPSQTAATVIGAETVNNSDWTMTNTGTGMKFTSKAGVVIPANGRSRIALTIKADTAGTSANLTTNITPSSGGDGVSTNNVAVLGMSVQN